MNKARYDVWDAAFERLDAEREVPTALHEALLRPGLFEGLGPVAAQEEATYVVRYWLHGFDWSPIPPRGPTIADQWHRIESGFGAHRAEEALRNYIPASRYDPDYREALNGIAVWHQEQGRLLPAPLAAWASQCYRGELPTPPKHRGDHGRPVYAQANRNLAMAEVFHLLGYLGLHEKLTRYHAIGAEFGCSEDTVRKALKTHHARWTGELPARGNAGRRPGAQTRPRASRVMDGHVRQIVSIDLRRSHGTMRST